jgi:hypothetical protein
MATIRLTTTQINAGVKRALKVFEKADTNGTGRVFDGEIAKYKGKGAAQLKKVFDYAQRVEGRGSEASLVKLSTVRSALKKLASGLDTIADGKGNKDGVLNGTAAELGKASNAGAALARFIHATK